MLGQVAELPMTYTVNSLTFEMVNIEGGIFVRYSHLGLRLAQSRQ